MHWPPNFRRASSEQAAIDREIAFHLEQETRAHMARGMSPSEARRQALLRFGGAEQVRQSVREVHTSAWLEGLFTNLRAAWRFARRSPAFALTMILTLALGIGVNSAVFSAVDAILLRPLPFPHGDELVRVHAIDLREKNPETFVAPLRLEDWNRMNSSFQGISGYYSGDATLTSGLLPEKIGVDFVAPRFLALWEIAPALGRDFTREEEKFGGPNALLVSHGFWLHRLHADPQAAGKTVRLGSVAYTVVGVMPATFLSPDPDADVWIPSPPDAPYAQRRDATWFTVLGRLKPRVTLAQGQADLATVQQQLGVQFPKTDGGLTIDLQPLKTMFVGGVASSLWLLYGSVSVLLLIACTNIAALLMARTAEREHEIAIRYSLGASRAALCSQLLTEVLLLAVAGSVLGLAIAAAMPRVFTLLVKDLPRKEEIGLNWHIAGYSLACALLCTVVCGMLPALRGTRRNLSGSMAQAGRTQVSARNPWQWTLVGVQVTLAVVLLVVSGLLLRSFQALGRVRTGFDADHVLTLHISAGWGETMDMGKLTQRINRVLEAMRNTPGVEAAATAGSLPGNGAQSPTTLKVTEHSADENQKIVADARIISSGYFATLRMPLLEGQPCREDAVGTAVVNRSFVKKYFSGRSALGYHLVSVPANEFMKPAEIRGVVGDAREQGVESTPAPTVYWCYSAPTPDPNYLVRTHGDPAAMAETLRQVIHQLEPSRSVFGITMLTEHLGERQSSNRLRTILLTMFALTAIALMSFGLYGTISYFGRTRRREIGLRLALGAMSNRIARDFVWQGLRVTLASCLIGLSAGAVATRLLAGMLFGVTALDPLTYAGVLLLTISIAFSALLLPSLRAVKVDPSQMLREE